jgi:hypothetical protein
MNKLKAFIAPLATLRAPLVVGLLYFLLLWKTPQLQEVYIILAEERSWLKIALALIFLILTSQFMWSVSTQLFAAHTKQNESELPPLITQFLHSYLVSILAALPFIGVSLGLRQTAAQLDLSVLKGELSVLSNLESPDAIPATTAVRELAEALSRNTREIEGIISIWSWSLLIIALIIALLPTLALLRGSPTVIICAPRPPFLNVRSKSFLLMAVFTGSLVACFSLQTLSTFTWIEDYIRIDSLYVFVEIPRWLGTIPLICTFIICITYFSAVLTKLADEVGLPLFVGLLILLFSVSVNDLNDNHGVRLVTTSDEEPIGKKLHSIFDDWFHDPSRLEYRKRYFPERNKPFPVYIMAAPGGGMYAANFAALFLAKIRDRCPRLAMHLFAVAGVSGGSIGTAFYNAYSQHIGLPSKEELKKERCDLGPHTPGKFERQLRKLLQEDYLAPVAAAALFPDFLQRFLPYPFSAFDRARAFEASLESTWDRVITGNGSNPLREPLVRNWRADNGVPALMAAATEVGSGNRVIISPFRLDAYKVYAGIHSLDTLHSLTSINKHYLRHDVPLSTAASLSARFPYILPPGSIDIKDGWKLRLVDGGYFEASAAETAKNISQYIQGYMGHIGHKAEVRLIVLEDVGMVMQKDEGLAELLSPVRTLWRTWSGRSPHAVHNALVYACGNLRCLASIWEPSETSVDAVKGVRKRMSARVRRVRLQNQMFHLPLGWQLSKKNQNMIARSIGRAENCIAGSKRLEKIFDQLRKESNHSSRAFEFFETQNENNCSLCSLVLEMRSNIKATWDEKQKRNIFGPDLGGRDLPCAAS